MILHQNPGGNHAGITHCDACCLMLGRSRESFYVQDMIEGCAATCPKSCELSLSGYLREYTELTGYRLDAKSEAKVLASCTRRCNSECSKGGNAYDYVTPFRKY